MEETMQTTMAKRGYEFGTAMLVAALACLLLAGSARATNSLYWGNYESSKISRTNLIGGGGLDLSISGTTPEGPFGTAVDTTTGKIYWANFDSNSIGFANLDGSGGGKLNTSGATIDEPGGLAIDPANGRIYWTNANTPAVSYANLNGSGGGDLNVAGIPFGEPYGLVVDPALGRLFWTDYENNTIAYANLNGAPGGILDTTGAPVEGPLGPAIDSTTQKIYWANFNGESIGYANLSGGGGGQLAITGLTVSSPAGLALDPASRQVYWANSGDGTIDSASLNGGAGTVLDIGAASHKYPNYPVLLESPRNTELPAIQGTHRAGTTLTCLPGKWADPVESFLYVAPQSYAYQWSRNGQTIAGATAATLVAKKVGAYSCGVTATNFAGSTGALSGTDFSVKATLGLKKIAFNRKKGTATLRVGLTGAGRLDLYGKGVANVSRKKAAGTAKLVVRSSGKARIKLNNTGKAKVKATVSYTPEGGKAIKRRKTIVLKKALRR
jgi:hypothetical protein